MSAINGGCLECGGRLHVDDAGLAECKECGACFTPNDLEGGWFS